MSKKSVVGIVKTHSQAEQIVEGLQDAGFPVSEISVLLPDNEASMTSAMSKPPKHLKALPPVQPRAV
jgi:hypothetical protein